MLLFIDICKALILLKLRFQYISCYCLSDSADDNSNRSKKFQYISCYCLSNPIARIPIPEHHFNTSHVTVYRLAGYVIHDNSLNFNTSHVTVYPTEKTYSENGWTNFNTSHVTVYLLGR